MNTNTPSTNASAAADKPAQVFEPVTQPVSANDYNAIVATLQATIAVSGIRNKANQGWLRKSK